MCQRKTQEKQAARAQSFSPFMGNRWDNLGCWNSLWGIPDADLCKRDSPRPFEGVGFVLEVLEDRAHGNILRSGGMVPGGSLWSRRASGTHLRSMRSPNTCPSAGGPRPGCSVPRSALFSIPDGWNHFYIRGNSTKNRKWPFGRAPS